MTGRLTSPSWTRINESSARYSICEDGRIYSTVSDRELYGHITENGYQAVTLSYDGESKGYRVHRLVAKAFLPNPENKPCINHKNGKRSDNRVENLEWCTYSENNQHMYDELGFKGSRHGQPAPTRKKVIQWHPTDGYRTEIYDYTADAVVGTGLTRNQIQYAIYNKTIAKDGFIYKYER